MNVNKHFLRLMIVIFCASCYPHLTPTETRNREEGLTSVPSMTVTPTEFQSYIGLVYPPLPGSIKTSLSWRAAIWSPSSVDWSIEVVRSGNNAMLWFSNVLRYDQNGKAYSQVHDIVMLPVVAKDEYIVVSECLFDGSPDPEIVALVKLDEESLLNRWLDNSDIILAWRANQSAGKLEQLDTKGIECNAETFLSFPNE